MRLSSLMLPVLLLALVFAAPCSALAKVHSWTDDSGVIHFSDKPEKRPDKQADQKAGQTSDTNGGASRQPAKAGELPPGKGAVFMWKVTSEDTFAYLLGSMHYASNELYPLDPRLEAAFRQCDALAVESDVEGQQAEIQMLAMKLGMYPEGDSLDRHITLRTEQLLRDMGAWNPMFLRLRPWLLAMQLQAQAFQKHGYDPMKGLDRHFLRLASQRGMPIKELEDAADTLQIFVDASSEDEDAFLYYSLLELERVEEVAPELARLWRSGDASGMRELIFYELGRRPEFEKLGTKLFDDRNVQMARKIAGYLQSGTPHFVVVGAGHLVGGMGIPELLEQQGFEARQIGTQQ